MNNRRAAFIICLALILPLTALLQGCVVATKDTVIAPEIQSLFKGTYKVYPYMEKHIPILVAVLPFVNVSDSQQGSQEVRKGFYNHFSSLPFKDMELYRVDNLLAKAGLTDPVVINKKTAQELGKILGVDAVVYGEISNFDKLFAVLYSQVSVGAKVRMVDTKSGEVLWTGEHVVRIHEGGLSTNPIGIVATIVATAMNVRDIQLLRACDDLFREMVKTIPVPTLAEALRPPVITLLVQDMKNMPKKAGDEIRVVIQGTPKMQAYFDIGEFKKYIDMQEQADTPGVYLGVYKVVPGDNVRKAVITGYLKDDRGNVGQWVDAVGTVTLKTTPPDKPAFLKAVGRNQLILLNWGKSSDPDLASYRLYRSKTPLSGYQEIVKTEVTEHRDQGLVNGEKYYYQVSAVDLAGNESDRTQTTGIPVAPGPTSVSGAIEADTVWYSGASPYVMETAVTVRDKATLTIEPGTEIRSKGGALIIEGSLQAQGDGEHVITWDTAVEGKPWGGLVFNNVKERSNVLKFNRIRNALSGITCQASSPRIESCELTENTTAVKVMGAFSAPRIVKNVIQKNTTAAVLIIDGARPVIQENTIQDNTREGILIQRAAPVVSRNLITRNRGMGVTVQNSQALIKENNIVDNIPLNMAGQVTGEAVNALDNWWGTAKGLDILSTIRGKINIQSILNGPYPEGKTQTLPILASTLSGSLKTDGYLILANSPYRVSQDVIIDGGATLYIEPGVVVQYDQKTVIVVEDGGIIAKGTADAPIVFTASGASPTPGFYAGVARFMKNTKVNSNFVYCILKFADIALDLHHGSPEISYCHITRNAQSGIFCRNDAAPTISYNTLSGNKGDGAITCVGNARPKINFNNIQDNDIAIRAMSSIYIDASQNWWGKTPPDMGMIWGDTERNINIKPPLTAPEPKAYREAPEKARF
ncbi:MAG: hypothetical protein CSYNP_00332 [Syntrophus sp. SKADARSKE-3]|nr:hypothetical protein [Syntrophus sp. SKADARSKE-3]